MAYVYKHTRLDKNEIFYIGIGSDSDGKYTRSKSKDSRNNHWHNIVNCTEYRIEILFDELTWEEANEKEVELIALYGRRNLGLGTLVNLTNGGDGMVGYKHSKESKIKISENSKGVNTWAKGSKHSEETIQKRANSNRGQKRSDGTRKKMSESQKGKKLSENHKQKISENHQSKKEGYINPSKGKKASDGAKKKMSENHASKKEGYINPFAKKVINTETNEIYNSVSELCKILGLNYKTITNKLNGHRKNNTPFKYID
jgi:hypothetical protein